MKKRWLFWILAVVITLGTAWYQRQTGPSNPKKVRFDGKILSCPRSMRTEITPEQAMGDWEKLNKSSVLTLRATSGADVAIFYKRVRSQDNWEKVTGEVDGNGRIKFTLPSQPPAGKLAYYVTVNGAPFSKEEPIVVRFRNNVPAWALIPHVLFMFAVMLLSTFCGFLALWNDVGWKKYARLTLAALIVGGLLLGPIVQKYAFGVYWSGWPLGEDFTDTKTLLAALFWVVALMCYGRKPGRWIAVAAAVALLAIYSIPHSTSGSEFNYETGLVETEK